MKTNVLLRLASAAARESFDMFILTDTFNKVVISKHRSVMAAVKAQHKHDRMVKRMNGKNSYVWYSITEEDEADITDELYECEARYIQDNH